MVRPGAVEHEVSQVHTAHHVQPPVLQQLPLVLADADAELVDVGAGEDLSERGGEGSHLAESASIRVDMVVLYVNERLSPYEDTEAGDGGQLQQSHRRLCLASGHPLAVHTQQGQQPDVSPHTAGDCGPVLGTRDEDDSGGQTCSTDLQYRPRGSG